MRYSTSTRWRVVMFALIGLALLLVATVTAAHGGIGTFDDSAHYVAAARSLLAGRGWLAPDGSPFLLWPPAYPTLLAGAAWLLSTDALTAGTLLNGGLLAGLWLLGGAVLRREGRAGRAAWLWWAVGLPVIHMALTLLSDLLFSVIVVGWLIVIEQYWQSGRRSLLIAAAALASVGALTRHVGVSLIVAGGVIVMLAPHHRHRLWLAGAAWLLSTATLPAIWTIRNLLLTGTASGVRPPSMIGPVENLLRVATTLAGWFLPIDPNADHTTKLAAAGLVLFVIGAAVVVLRRSGAWRDMTPALIFAGAYVGVVVSTASLVGYEALGTRLLAPLYLPALWGLTRLVRLAPALLEGRAQRWGRAVRLAVCALSLAWVGLTAVGAVVWGWGSWGGFSSRDYATSGAMQYLQTHAALPGALYSNSPSAIYLFSGAPAEHIPARRWYAGNPATPDIPLQQYSQVWPPTYPAYLVLFWPEEDRFYRVDEFLAVYDLTPLGEWAGSAVYEIRGPRP